MTTLYSFQKPYKVWSCDRISRKSVVASSLLELKLRGAEKLGYEQLNISDLKIVLEADGTEVEDDSYFQTADKDTIFLLLTNGEKWLTPGVEELKAAITAIPGIVCDALNKMELVGEAPSWKIMDNRGNVTVVLNWDHRDRVNGSGGRGGGEPGWRLEVSSKPSDKQTAAQSNNNSNSRTTHPMASSSSNCSPSSAAARAKLTLEGLNLRPTLRLLPNQRQTLSNGSGLGLEEDDEEEEEDDSDEDLRTERELSSTHDHSRCDFHCAALHREGTQIQVNKSVATSPIQESVIAVPIVPTMSSSADNISATGAIPKRKEGGAKGHVRFMDIEATKIPIANGSDSETETTEAESEQLCERYLILVDQLSVDQDRHLTVKDIGTILERLSSKIVDIDKLERERETSDCYNWMIKATIRGEVLREIGVIYNGQYYGIMEHPGYF